MSAGPSSDLRFLPWAAVSQPVSLPYPSLGAGFAGRADALDRIHQAARRGDGPHEAVTAQVIEGPGGIGKTRLAVEYAWAHAGEYTALLFVLVESAASLTAGLAALTGVLAPNDREAGDAPRKAELAIAWLRANPGWLLILDDVDTDDAAAAAHALVGRLRGGHVLLTSRRHGFAAGVEVITLNALDGATAAALLLSQTEGYRQTAPSDNAEAHALAADLDGLPLALDMAAATIRRNGLSLAAWRHAWRENRDSVSGWGAPIIGSYLHPVDAAWGPAVAALPPAARWLLDHLAFLAPDPVPESLLDVPIPGDEAAPDNGLAAITELADRHLLARDSDLRRFTIHAMVQDVVRRSLAPDMARTRLTETLTWLTAAFQGDADDIRTWPRLEPLAPHAEALVWRGDRAGLADQAGLLMGAVGSLLHNKAEFARAEPLMRRALAITEASLGADHPNVARDLNNLAQLLKATNRLAEAEPLMRRALAITEASLGADHSNVATGLNNLAMLLQATNRLAEAEPLMRRALDIDEASLGADHPNVAIRLNNLAQLLQATNRLAEAEPLMRRALAIDEASLGADHPNVATGLNNLAMLLKDTNRLAEVEPLMRRALAIDEASLGADHPNVAIRLNNLAHLLQATNRPAEAEPLMRRALAIDEASLGADHPSVAIDLNNLAHLLQATNRLVEAEPLMRRALAIDEASLGADHPNVATGLNNLARLLQATNRLAEAEPLMRRMVVIFLNFERNTGHAHPHRDTAVGNYESLLANMGRDEAAIRAAIESVRRETGRD